MSTDLIGKQQVAHGVVIWVLHDGTNHLQHWGDACKMASPTRCVSACCILTGRCPGDGAGTSGPGSLTSGSSQALTSAPRPTPRPPPVTSARGGLREGLRVHVPVPPAIMPTDFTVLMTGSDFLSGRMANFPGEKRRGEAQVSNTGVWGSVRLENLAPLRGPRCGQPPYNRSP